MGLDDAALHHIGGARAQFAVKADMLLEGLQIGAVFVSGARAKAECAGER